MKEDLKAICTFILGWIIIAAMLFISAIVQGCTAKASAAIPEKELLLMQDTVQLNKIIRAYNHLLHRVWLDKPNYVEDCLVESDEFTELDSLLDGGWADTFDFYNEEDSIAYSINWVNGDETVRVVKHVVIPEPAKSRLKSVFLDFME